MSKWLAALVLTTLGCSTGVAPRFASWEPVLEAIPKAGSAQAEDEPCKNVALSLLPISLCKVDP